MRRFIIYGAGAVGGALGAELSLAGEDVILIARGAHREALEREGLEYVTPESTRTLSLLVVESAEELDMGDDDIVIITTKSQDTMGVLDALERVAPPDTPIVCAQNGVANEDLALRRFPNVYGVCVVTPAAHLRPGQVIVYAAPNRGIFHLGRYPAGPDPFALEIAESFTSARFRTFAHDDARPYKYAKLIGNLANSAQAVLEPSAVARVAELARAEGRAAYAAAGVSYLDDEAFAKSNADLQMTEVAGHERSRGSTWQSLARGATGIESDYLNGEIVLLGRLHGVPTQVNALLQRLSNEALRSHAAPGAYGESAFLAMLGES